MSFSFFRAAHRITGNSAFRPTFLGSLGDSGHLKSSEAYSPGSVTGFFAIHDRDSDLLKVGSTGASVTLNEGVLTRVTLRNRPSQRIRVSFNGRKLSQNSVSVNVAKRYTRLDGRGWDLNASHSSKLPVGRGYGTSGAGALSLSYALNDAMGLSLSNIEAGQIAHLSELSCRTGLGTVLSEFFGGLNIRTEPGAPGEGKVTKIPFARSSRLVTTSFAPIPTQRVLTSYELREQVNSCARSLVSKLRRKKTPDNFMKLSRKFAECVGLKSRGLRRLMAELDRAEVLSSMAMLGQTVFCIVPYDKVFSAASAMRYFGSIPIISELSKSGARLL